jgi:exodeoxyribonuclease VII small subunit
VAKDKHSERGQGQGQGQYSDVVQRLEQIVSALEAGDLALEASLEQFAEGVKLVKQGEQLLGEAEKRIEQLLSDDGRTAPFKVPEDTSAAAQPVAPAPAHVQAPRAPARRPAAPPAPSLDDDDVPF